MKSIAFYYERASGGVLAVKRPSVQEILRGKRQAVGGRYRRPNSEPKIVTVSAQYLRRCCERVSEAKARELHPKLFEHAAVKSECPPWPLAGLGGLDRWR